MYTTTHRPTHTAATALPERSRLKSHAHPYYAHSHFAAAARTPPAAVRCSTPVRTTTPKRSTTPLRAAAAATPTRHYGAQAAAPSTPERQSSSGFMTQAARGAETPRNQMSRPSAHAHTAPLRRGPALLPDSPLAHRQLLVLDMDETLLHAEVSPVRHDVSFVVNMDNGSSTPVYVKFRPHLNRFLSIVSRMFEVVVFTASISRYANQVLDYIDPTGSLVHHRLYREHCTETNGTYVKDLERLGRPLDRISIVDNSPVAYSFHPENAIAIPSWYDCDRDEALRQLLPHLERMARGAHVYDGLDGIRRQLRWD